MRINRGGGHAIFVSRGGSGKVQSDGNVPIEKEGIHGHNQFMYDREK